MTRKWTQKSNGSRRGPGLGATLGHRCARDGAIWYWRRELSNAWKSPPQSSMNLRTQHVGVRADITDDYDVAALVGRVTVTLRKVDVLITTHSVFQRDENGWRPSFHISATRIDSVALRALVEPGLHAALELPNGFGRKCQLDVLRHRRANYGRVQMAIRPCCRCRSRWPPNAARRYPLQFRAPVISGHTGKPTSRTKRARYGTPQQIYQATAANPTSSAAHELVGSRSCSWPVNCLTYQRADARRQLSAIPTRNAERTKLRPSIVACLGHPG